MRLIDADATKQDFNLNFGSVTHAVCANRIVDRQPTIDAVPVLRCWDCKNGTRLCDGYVRCSHPAGKVLLMTSTDFCSRGERKDSVTDG
jgi:hypothetical protein